MNFDFLSNGAICISVLMWGVLKRQPSATILIKKHHEVGGKLEVVVMEKQDAILIPDATTIVLGKLKSINLIENLHTVCKKEYFKNVDITYIGGLWVWIDLITRAHVIFLNKGMT